MFARSGELTPPTILQTFFFGVRIARVRIDPKHDIDVIPGHFHPLHEGTDEVPLTRPIGVLSSAVDLGSTIFETSDNQRQFSLYGGLIFERLALCLYTGEALVHAGHPGLKLVLVDASLRITVD